MHFFKNSENVFVRFLRHLIFCFVLTLICALHSGIHKLKQSLPKRWIGKMTMYDPIFPVAMEIAEETCLICFDEFQVRAEVGKL